MSSYFLPNKKKTGTLNQETFWYVINLQIRKFTSCKTLKAKNKETSVVDSTHFSNYFDGNQETQLGNKKLFSCFLKVSYLQVRYVK